MYRIGVNNVGSPYKCLRPTLRKVAIPTDTEKVNGRYIHTTPAVTPVACGKCANCRLLKSRQWASRLVWERYYNRDNENYHTYFITFTFDRNHEVVNNGYDSSAEKGTYKYLQKLFKRLRRGSTYLPPLDFRYYVAGEFGEVGSRFHYHVLLMVKDNRLVPEWLTKYGKPKGLGLEFRDVLQPNTDKPMLALHYIQSRKKRETRLQTPQEATLSFILACFYWPFGNVSVGSADTVGGCHYVTKTMRYITKLSKKERENCENGKIKDFHRQSLNLGIKFHMIGNHKRVLDEFCGIKPKAIFDNTTNVIRLNPFNQDSNGIVPIPRYWRTLYCNDEERVRRLPSLLDRLTTQFCFNHYFGVKPEKLFTNHFDSNTDFDDAFCEDMPFFCDHLNNSSLVDLPLWMLC